MRKTQYSLVIVMVALSIMLSLPIGLAQGRHDVLEANGYAVVKFTDGTRVKGRATVHIWGSRYGWEITVMVGGSTVAQWNRALEDFDVRRGDPPEYPLKQITSYDHALYGTITVKVYNPWFMIAYGSGGLIKSLLFFGGPVDYQIIIA